MGNFCCSDPEDGHRDKSPTDNVSRPIMQPNNESMDESSDALETNELKSESRNSFNSSTTKTSSKQRNSNSPSTSTSDSDSTHQPSKPYVIIITGPDLEEVINETNTTTTTKTTNIKRSKPDIIDTTLGGIIQWKKVADFSALLPRDVKLKLWKGVFKTEEDGSISEGKKIKNIEIKKLSKILRTFVMLQLTRQYKKNGNTVPIEIKKELPFAVKEPSKFISNFLKNDENIIRQSLITIYETLCEQCHNHSSATNDKKKKEKYVKKLQSIQVNYQQLCLVHLKNEFNKEDFLKNAFLQYMLYAFQFKLDSMTHNKRR